MDNKPQRNAVITMELPNGHIMRYLHHPQPDKPTLVILPGGAQEIESLSYLSAGLARHFNCYVLELPGMGLTPALKPYYDYAFWVECLHLFVVEQQHTVIHLFAISSSTPVGLEYATHYPDRLGRMALGGPTPGLPVHAWETFITLMADCLHDKRRFVTNYFAVLTDAEKNLPRQHMMLESWYEKAKHYSEDQCWLIIYNCIRLMAYQCTDMDQIPHPTLFFTGEYDPYSTPEACRAYAELMPQGQSATVSQADHFVHIQNPKETIALIADFLLEHSEQKELTQVLESTECGLFSSP